MSESNQQNLQGDDKSKVAHELNNLIQIISGTSSLIENIFSRIGEDRPVRSSRQILGTVHDTALERKILVFY